MKFSRSFVLPAIIAFSMSVLPLIQPLQAAETKRPGATQKKGDTRGSKHRRGQRRDPMAMMTEYLQLTKSQQARIKPIVEQSRQRALKVRADKSLSPEQKRAKMRVIQTDAQKKIYPILTTTQRKKVEDLMREGGPRRSRSTKH